jgi:ribosomal protein S18 acetylase RimI-like enzyme
LGFWPWQITDRVMADLIVAPAQPADRACVLQLLFQRAANEIRQQTVEQGMNLLSTGVIDPAGLLAARCDGRLVGAILSGAAPGAVGMIWPPQVVPAETCAPIEDALLAASLKALRQGGVKLLQALLAPVESDLGAALERNGFRHMTRLLYLLRRLEDLPLDSATSLAFEPSCDADSRLFTETLRQTYMDTLDCPELDSTRSMEEVVAGYRGQPGHDPSRWWLVWFGRNPVGVLLANSSVEEAAWEILYFGVVPAARGKRIGRFIVQHALKEARAAAAEMVRLAVDRRNIPALRLYKRLEFQIWDEREVFVFTIHDERASLIATHHCKADS